MFLRRTSAEEGGGQALVQNYGDKCRMGGGNWQNFRRMGGPPVPPGKKTPALWPMGKKHPVVTLNSNK